MSTRLSRDEARHVLLAHHGLRAVVHPPGPAGVRSLLARRRCIQLDPLDAIGTNADLVALARVDGLRKGDVYDAVLPGHAFEHFFKERCLIPADAFPAYRVQAAEPSWWRSGHREQQVSERVLAEVLSEIEARGPCSPDDLTHHGEVEPIDWSGWKGTAKRTTMALELLWRRCQVVVVGRTTRGKLFDVPRRALPAFADAPPPENPAAWAVEQRAEAMGLLPTAVGPWWGRLRDARADGTVDRLLAEGRLVRVTIDGSRREWLAPADLLDRPRPDDDGRLRILGPLDPLLWDRKLVEQVWGFRYVWEVYKPAAKREYGWYVVPLLHEGRLVGRLEAHVEAGELVVDRLWEESGRIDPVALREAVARHGAAVATPRSPGGSPGPGETLAPRRS